MYEKLSNTTLDALTEKFEDLADSSTADMDVHFSV